MPTLTFLGLILSFVGSTILVYDALKNISKPGSVYLPNNKELGWKSKKYERDSKGFLNEVKFTKEEINLAVSLVLLSAGFLLQILDFFI